MTRPVITRRSRAVSLAVVSGAPTIVGAVHLLIVPAETQAGFGFRGFALPFAVSYVTVGTFLAFRRPENRIGWLFLVQGLLFSTMFVCAEYAIHGLIIDPGSYPGALTAAWVMQWLWVVPIGLIALVLVTFPDGKFRSRSWARLGKIIVIVTMATGAMHAFLAGPLDSFSVNPIFRNPYALFSLDPEVVALGMVPWVLCVAAGFGALFLRFRNARGIERQQLKSLGLGGALITLSLATGIFLQSTPAARFSEVVVTIALTALPVTMGVAIVRHQLYDIDVVINRTLVYGALTAVLAALYIGLVFGFQAILSPFTAESDLAIAASTLAIAALFRPLRSRVQRFIDRRFYRRKFDVQRTLEEFGQGVRDEVELSALSTHLTEVVANTMQPAHLSLWLRGKT